MELKYLNNNNFVSRNRCFMLTKCIVSIIPDKGYKGCITNDLNKTKEKNNG